MLSFAFCDDANVSWHIQSSFNTAHVVVPAQIGSVGGTLLADLDAQIDSFAFMHSTASFALYTPLLCRLTQLSSSFGAYLWSGADDSIARDVRTRLINARQYIAYLQTLHVRTSYAVFE